MANTHTLFQKFDKEISLDTAKKQDLRRSRKALRSKIRAKFREKGYDIKFHEQGSLAMGTIIQPKDDNYDVDDGSYILQEEKPIESIVTLHQWIVDAARNHTQKEPEDRGPCVRVLFAKGYHVDLVLYHKRDAQHPELAHRFNGWIQSDPKTFMDWFAAKAAGEPQLKRLVRYFKAWGDNLRGDMPPGIIFTILTAKFYEANDRDDVAFLKTMRAMRDSLKVSFVCQRPTVPREDLFSSYSSSRQSYLLSRLDSFIRSGEEAIAAERQIDACKKWSRHFGERFSCAGASETLENAANFTAPAFIKSDAKSA